MEEKDKSLWENYMNQKRIMEEKERLRDLLDAHENMKNPFDPSSELVQEFEKLDASVPVEGAPTVSSAYDTDLMVEKMQVDLNELLSRELAQSYELDPEEKLEGKDRYMVFIPYKQLKKMHNDKLLDLYNDYKGLHDQFGDAKYKRQLDSVTKALAYRAERNLN
jgi:hypothetical protein